MPIFGWKCVSCGIEVDRLMSYDKMKSVEMICKSCNIEMRRTITAPAKTASGWGDQGVVTGIYNKGLGCFVKSDRDADRIAKERGLIRFQEAFNGSSYERVLDENVDSQCNISLQHNRDAVQVQDKVKAGAEMGEAFAEVFSVDRMKADGLLPKDIQG